MAADRIPARAAGSMKRGSQRAVHLDGRLVAGALVLAHGALEHATGFGRAIGRGENAGEVVGVPAGAEVVVELRVDADGAFEFGLRVRPLFRFNIKSAELVRFPADAEVVVQFLVDHTGAAERLFGL